MIRKKVRTIYVILAFLLAGLLFTLTGFADQEVGEPETAAAETEVSTESPEDPTEPGTEPATEPERARVTVSYQIDSVKFIPPPRRSMRGNTLPEPSLRRQTAIALPAGRRTSS